MAHAILNPQRKIFVRFAQILGNKKKTAETIQQMIFIKPGLPKFCFALENIPPISSFADGIYTHGI